MFFILSKILLFFTYPLTWILVIILLSYFLRKKHISKYLRISAIVLFLFLSNTVIYHKTLQAWEGSNEGFNMPNPKAGDTPYDAIVLLGGFSGWNTTHQMVSFNHNADRFLETLKAYHGGICKKIIISGGSGQLTKPEERESVWAKDYLIKLGVQPEDVLIEKESKNTHENAVNTAELIQSTLNPNGKYLLVTSAFHMKRARGCFEKTELDFDFYRVGFIVDDEDFTADKYLIPSALTLDAWQILIKEWIGYVTYLFQGYL